MTEEDTKKIICTPKQLEKLTIALLLDWVKFTKERNIEEMTVADLGCFCQDWIRQNVKERKNE